MNLLVSLFGAIILIAVLLLGIGTGLLSRFFKYDLRKHLIITALFSIIIALIIIALSPFYETVISLTVNNFYFYLAMALISLVLGIMTFYLWSQEEYTDALKVILFLDFVPVSYGLFILSSAALSPSFVFNTANISLNVTTIHLAIIIAILLMIISIAAYRFSDFIEDYRMTHYPIIYGSMMVIFAFIFIVFGFLIPTIGKVLENPSTELTLMPIESGIVLIVILALLLGLGVLFRKRNNRLE
ncbi:DUF2162 family putative transporter [Methanobrevibacter sp.]|uniref:DUF2162 family putative transporter n=1 Tax=Methanobrevibacter sp. TaxID=66852 RepID=UPI00388DA61C